jgi:AraC-like DNA-binding protein
MSLSFLGLVYFIAFAQAMMMVAILLKNSESHQPGRILAWLLVIMAYKLFEGGVLNSDLYRYVPHLIDWMAGVALLIGPLFYAYVHRMSGHAAWSTSKWLLNLAPFLVLFSFQLPDLWVPAAQKIVQIEFYQTNQPTGTIPLQFVALLVAIKFHLGVYLWGSWQMLAKAETHAENQTADDAYLCLLWQKKLCLMLIALETTWVVLFLGQQFWGLTTLNAVSDYWLLLMSAVVLLMGYWGLQKPHLMLEAIDQVDDKSAVAKANTVNEADDKYKNSVLDEATSQMIADEIYQSMTQDQLYLESTLNLSMLSEHLGIRKHLVSQVINQTLNTTFFKLINSYRVKHAKFLMGDVNCAFTLERIAVESGFNNRVTFNKAFKEEEGNSPSIYRKTLKLAS